MTQVRPGTGGHLALDLINTDAVMEGQRRDALPTVTALAEWCAAVGIAGAEDLSGGRRTLAFAHRLRAAWRAALDATTAGPEAWAAVDAVLAEAPAALRIAAEPTSASGRSPVLGPVADGDGAGARVRVALAVATADVVRHDPMRVRTCAAPDCTLMFLDTSKGGRRRWCAMATCGNRAKLMALRQRRSTS